MAAIRQATSPEPQAKLAALTVVGELMNANSRSAAYATKVLEQRLHSFMRIRAVITTSLAKGPEHGITGEEHHCGYRAKVPALRLLLGIGSPHNGGDFVITNRSIR